MGSRQKIKTDLKSRNMQLENDMYFIRTLLRKLVFIDHRKVAKIVRPRHTTEQIRVRPE